MCIGIKKEESRYHNDIHNVLQLGAVHGLGQGERLLRQQRLGGEVNAYINKGFSKDQEGREKKDEG